MGISEICEYKITAAAIDDMADKIDQYLTHLRMEGKNRLRIRLSMEEMLLKWRDHFGEDTVCSLIMGTQFGRPRLILELKGEPFDPTTPENEDFSGWSDRLLGNMGLCPLYSYTNGRNQVLLKLKKPRRNPLIGLMVSFGLAILVGLMGPLLPENVVGMLLENLISPVYETFLGVLGTIAGPMVFLAVAWGIYGIGDISALGRIGKRMLLRFIGITFLIVTFTAAVSVLALRVNLVFDQGTDTSQLWSILHMLLAIFPDNMVQPFLEGNSMQIILAAVFVGGALLVLGKQTSAVSTIIEQLNYVVNFLIELITSLVPWFIFVVVVQMFWTGSFGIVTQAWQAFAVFLAAMLVVLVLLFLWVAGRNKISPVILLKKCAETFVVALTTASSTATFGTALHCCERRLGIGNYLTSFGLPLGLVFYAPATAAYFLIISFYVAGSYGVEISLAWIFVSILISVILAVASPPIPGGTLVCYTVMFSQLGIPEEGLVVAMAIDVLFDFIATAMNMVMLELELTCQAQKMKLLDHSVLIKNKE